MIHQSSPVTRAPAPMRQAVESASHAFVLDPSKANWETLQAAVQRCLDADDARRRNEAAA